MTNPIRKPRQPQPSRVALWEIDRAHSSAAFSVRHMMFAKVHGRFKGLSGRLRFDRLDPTRSSVEAIVDAASVDTRDTRRDDFLKSGDFFDVQKHPRLTFKSKRVELVRDGLMV